MFVEPETPFVAADGAMASVVWAACDDMPQELFEVLPGTDSSSMMAL